MRASEFISESELKQLNEKGFKDAMKGVGKSVAGGAANFAHGAGMLSDKDMDSINKGLGTAEKVSADNASKVIMDQLARINKFAKEQGLKPGDGKYDKAVEGAVNSLFAGLRVDTKNPKIQKAIDAVLKVALTDQKGLPAAMKQIVEPMMKVKNQGNQKTPTTNPKLKDATPFTAFAVPGPNKEDNKPAIYVDKDDNGQWEKYVDNKDDGVYEKVNITPAQMEEFERTIANNAREMNFVRVDDNNIGFADDKQDNALHQDADNEVEQEQTNTDELNKLAQAVYKNVQDAPDEEKVAIAEKLLKQIVINRKMEEKNATKLRDLVKAGLKKLAQGEEPEDAQDDEQEQTDEQWGDKFVNMMVDHIKQNAAEFPDHDAAGEFLDRQLEHNKITDTEEQDRLKERVFADPSMSWNYTPDDEFRGLVYSPGGTRFKQDADDTDNTAYVKSQNSWGKWSIGPSSSWSFQEKVTNSETIGNLESLAKKNDNAVVPMTFRKDDVEGKEDLYRVSSK